jgi:hypothetical protein
MATGSSHLHIDVMQLPLPQRLTHHSSVVVGTMLTHVLASVGAKPEVRAGSVEEEVESAPSHLQVSVGQLPAPQRFTHHASVALSEVLLHVLGSIGAEGCRSGSIGVKASSFFAASATCAPSVAWDFVPSHLHKVAGQLPIGHALLHQSSFAAGEMDTHELKSLAS